MPSQANRKRGRPTIAADGYVDVRLRWSPRLLARVDAAAREDGRSRDSWVRMALERETSEPEAPILAGAKSCLNCGHGCSTDTGAFWGPECRIAFTRDLMREAEPSRDGGDL